MSRFGTTHWYTRREPVFRDGDFVHETDGVDVERRVLADAALGLPPRSVVSYTDLGWTSYALAAKRRGILVRKPMFTRIDETGVIEADCRHRRLDAIIWATGFRPALAHLDPMRLTGPLGGIPVDGTAAARDHRIHLIGYGPSQSTVGANRAGRAAAVALTGRLGTQASGRVQKEERHAR